VLGPRHTRLLLLLAACPLSLGACGSKQQPPPADWIATVDSVSGQVQVVEAPDAPVLTGKKGQLLRVGGRLTTGPKSHAILVLRNGGRLTVRPDSVVSFASSLPEKTLKRALERGSVEGKSGSGEASELVIGVGERLPPTRGR